MSRPVLACALAFALLAPTAFAKSGASGTVTLSGKSWPVADAVATLNGEDLELVFAQKSFDRAKWAEDGEFGTFDLWEFKDNDAGDGQSISIRIDNEDDSYGGHNLRLGSGGSSGGFSSDYDNAVTLTARDDTHVAGTLKMTGDEIAADISFELPLTKYGPLARAGSPLPADGGDPGKALKAVIEATHAGDLDKMIALSHPEKRAMIEESKAKGEAAQMLEMAKLFTPKLGKITGGTVDGDRAYVDFDGTEEGRSVQGTAELLKFEGKWYVESINTKS